MLGRRGGGRNRTLLLAAALVALGATLPPGVAAADPAATQVLPGRTIAAITADLDDDGAAEVVRLLDESDPGLTVEAWALDDTRWTVVGAAQLRPPLAGGSLQPIPNAEIAALLRWKLDGHDRVLALTAEVDPSDPFGRSCCLAVSDVRLRGAGIVLEPLAGLEGTAEVIQAVDLDGDATDELVLQRTTYEGEVDEGTFRARVLRWGQDGFDMVFETEVPGQGVPMMAADSDGIAGDEVIMGPSDLGDLMRFGWIDGEIRLEQAHLDVGERFPGWLAGAADGSMVVTDDRGLRVIRWPRGGSISTVARIENLSFPWISVIGDGADALVVAQDGFDFAGAGEPATTVHDLELRHLGKLGVAPGTEAVWEVVNDRSQRGLFSIQRSVNPYVGPIPGGIDGRAAHLASGVLIQPDGAGGFESRMMASLIGYQPLGLAGPQASWMALGEGLIGGIDAAYLYGGGPPYGSGQLALTPLDELLLPDAEAQRTAIELRDAVEVSRERSRSTLLAAADGFEAVIAAPPDSEVIVGNGNRFETHRIADAPLLLEIDPRGRRQGEDEAFERLVFIITPDGRGSLVLWEGTFVRELPELVARAGTEVFALRSTITGRSPSGASVTVDGQPVMLSRDGAFRVHVDAPIWPRDVIVVARDPLGNEAVSRIQVVGFLDYRGLPWAAIVGLATLASGAFLFLRTPGRPAEVRRPSWDDAQLEEIDAD